MSETVQLTQPKSMCFSSANSAETWSMWEVSFRTYRAAAQVDSYLTRQDPGCNFCYTVQVQKRNTYLLTFSLVAQMMTKSDNIENVITKFRQYCEPKKNILFETYKFWGRDQHEGERPFDKWVNDLRIILQRQAST